MLKNQKGYSELAPDNPPCGGSAAHFPRRQENFNLIIQLIVPCKVCGKKPLLIAVDNDEFTLQYCNCVNIDEVIQEWKDKNK